MNHEQQVEHMHNQRKSLPPKRGAQRGQSLVELAISLTVILWLLAGAIDLGSALFAWIALRDAAEEGALYASLYPTVDSNNNGRYDNGEAMNTAAIAARVRVTSTNPVNLNDAVNVTVNVEMTSPPCAGGAVTVTVIYNYRIMMPLTSTIIGTNTIPIRASATNTLLRYSCP